MSDKKTKLDGRIVKDAYEVIAWVVRRLGVLVTILDVTDRSHHSTRMEMAHHLLSASIDDLKTRAMRDLEKNFNIE